uniref:Uncharacterized protein n=1 Tax=Anguilla anguilla TaxID=7936 RepID=A0A0E9RGG4_ANGAN
MYTAYILHIVHLNGWIFTYLPWVMYLMPYLPNNLRVTSPVP